MQFGKGHCNFHFNGISLSSSIDKLTFKNKNTIEEFQTLNSLGSTESDPIWRKYIKKFVLLNLKRLLCVRGLKLYQERPVPVCGQFGALEALEPRIFARRKDKLKLIMCDYIS